MRALTMSMFLLPVPLCAQSGGPTLALPHAFSVDPTTALPGVGPGDVATSDYGIDGVLPSSTAPAGPDFATFLGGVPVDVDALSIGLDWVVANVLGEAVVAPPQWAAISFSISRGTTGAPGGLIADEVATPEGASADVFAYVIPGSALPPAIVGVPFRAQDGAEIDVALGSAPLGNLDAHDVFISLIYEENPQLAPLLPPPTVFFSVTAASVGAIPPSWTTDPVALSGATVFATTWLPTTGTWSPITVAYTAGDFGLDPAEDLDALALDLAQGFALFSTDPLLPSPAGPRDPILFCLPGTGANSVYRLPNGSPISTEVTLGLGPDDVDGICSLDPGSAAQPSPINLPMMLGTPGPPVLPGLANQVQASASRTFDPISNQEFCETWMTGWPPPGNPQLSLAVSAAALNNAFGGYVVLDVHVRPAGSPFQGHPERTQLFVPPGIVFSGQQLFFLWGTLSPTTFDTSLPLRITL
ncbi:MAG: hypothetical protein KAI24_12065 [Planctomycetes bacterium]|nr:hypothetical protein [Planctomycetota bacterium]